MTQDVRWPKASEGGKVVGKEEVCAYWTRQWGEFDPHVESLAITECDRGQGPGQGAPTRQEPSRGCSIGQRSSARIHSEHCLIAAWDLRDETDAPLLRLLHSHIDPKWLPAGERESRKQPRESRTGSKPHSQRNRIAPDKPATGLGQTECEETRVPRSLHGTTI